MTLGTPLLWLTLLQVGGDHLAALLILSRGQVLLFGGTQCEVTEAGDILQEGGVHRFASQLLQFIDVDDDLAKAGLVLALLVPQQSLLGFSLIGQALELELEVLAFDALHEIEVLALALIVKELLFEDFLAHLVLFSMQV